MTRYQLETRVNEGDQFEAVKVEDLLAGDLVLLEEPELVTHLSTFKAKYSLVTERGSKVCLEFADCDQWADAKFSLNDIVIRKVKQNAVQ